MKVDWPYSEIGQKIADWSAVILCSVLYSAVANDQQANVLICKLENENFLLCSTYHLVYTTMWIPSPRTMLITILVEKFVDSVREKCIFVVKFIFSSLYLL